MKRLALHLTLVLLVLLAGFAVGMLVGHFARPPVRSLQPPPLTCVLGEPAT